MRLLSLCLLFFGMLLLAVPLPACTPQPGQPFALPEIHWEPDEDVALSYGVLLLDQGLREDDAELIVQGARALAEISPTAQPFVDAAAWLLLNRSPALARDVLDPALRRFPDDMNIHMLMAEAWLEDNGFDEAEAVIKGYQAAHPDSVRARQELGVLYTKMGRNAEAVAVFGALPSGTFSAFARYCYAKALAGQERIGDAIAQLRLTVDDMPEFVEAWMELARLLEERKEYPEAAAIYEQHVLEQDPTNNLAWMRLISVYLDAGDRDSAMEVAQNYRDSVGGVFPAVSLFLDRKCYAEAETLLSSMLQKPDVPEELYFYMAATVYEGKKDIPGALQWLGHITPGNRLYGRALHLHAQMLMEQKDYPACLDMLAEARKAAPDEFALALMQAHVLNQLHRYDESLAVLDKGIEQWPDVPELRYSKGMSLDLAGRKAEALKLMEALAADLPDYYQALNYIGYSLADQGRELPRALELLSRADALAPDTAYILDSLAWARFKAGQVAAAWEAIKRAVALEDGQDPVIWEHYGDIARARGKAREARSGYLKALEIGHDKPDVIREKMGQIP